MRGAPSNAVLDGDVAHRHGRGPGSRSTAGAASRPPSVTYVTLAFRERSETFATNDVRALRARRVAVDVQCLLTRRRARRLLARRYLRNHFEATGRERSNTAWWDAKIMGRLATGLAYFVLDTDQLDSRSDPFAAGVSGDRTVDMLPPTEYRERITVFRIASTPFAAYAAWDASGTLMETILEVYDLFEGDPNAPESVDLPAAMLLGERIADAGRTR